MVKGYAAGVNAYLRDVGGSKRITDPACKGARWVRPDATAKDIWYAVYAANLLASTGVFVPQIAGAAPRRPPIPACPSAGDRPAAPRPTDVPERKEFLAALGKDPDSPFGSNATAVGKEATTTGRGMVLGNPHFPWRGRYRFTQFHLTIPGKYDVAGAGLIGSPVVNIGWNKDVAWSHTVSTAYRFTPYEYKTVPGTQYLTEDGSQEPEHRTVPVRVRAADGTVSTVQEDVYRTDEGYVLDAPDALMPWSPAASSRSATPTPSTCAPSTRSTRWARPPGCATCCAARTAAAACPGSTRPPRTVAASALRRPLGRAQRARRPRAGVPHPDRGGARPGRRPARARRHPGQVRLRVAHRRRRAAAGHLRAAQPAQHGPQGLGGQRQRQLLAAQPGPAAGGVRRDHRLRAGALAAPADGLPLRHRPARRQRRPGPQPTRQPSHPQALRAREPRLRCRARPGGRRPARRLPLPTGERPATCWPPGTAAPTSTAWGRRSSRSSGSAPGRHRAVGDAVRPGPAGDDPAQPRRDQSRGGPGDARRARLPRRAGIDPATPWGRLQVAGDEGAPPIAVGGGEGFAGNANAVASWAPASNTGRLYPISYGSSHIQAVAFQDRGRVAAHTILTYGESMDPTRRTSRTRPGCSAGSGGCGSRGPTGRSGKRRCGPVVAAADRTGGQRPGGPA